MKTLASFSLFLLGLCMAIGMNAQSNASHGIVMQPEGTLMVFDRSGEGIYPDGDSLFTTAQQGKAYVVFDHDGKTVYLLQPLFSLPYNYWVKGELNEDGTSFDIPLGQYVFWSDHYEAGLVLSWGSTSYYTGSDGHYRYSFQRDREATVVTYAINGNTITMCGSDGDIGAELPHALVGTGLSANWDDNGDWHGIVEWKTTYNGGQAITQPTPADPVIHEWYDCGAEWGGSYLYFDLPAWDTDGNPISIENLSYSIFVDQDQLLTFDKDTYQYLEQDMSEFPYGFKDADLWGDFMSNLIFFYRTNEGSNGEEPLFTWRIGIQLYYTSGDVRTASNIVYVDVYPHSGVNEMLAGKQVANVRYYDMAGQQVTQPSGLVIQVTTYTDGTTRAIKVVK